MSKNTLKVIIRFVIANSFILGQNAQHVEGKQSWFGAIDLTIIEITILIIAIIYTIHLYSKKSRFDRQCC